VKYVTWLDRFQLGDFPMVCVRSGLPATKVVAVQARRTAVWPWLFFPISTISWFLLKSVTDSRHPWGKLPFAEGQVKDITATYEKRIGVIIKGAHPDFIKATQQHQHGAPN